jgi:hypothetical protein
MPIPTTAEPITAPPSTVDSLEERCEADYARRLLEQLSKNGSVFADATYVLATDESLIELNNAADLVKPRSRERLRSPIPISADAFNESEIELEDFAFDYDRAQRVFKWVREKYGD